MQPSIVQAALWQYHGTYVHFQYLLSHLAIHCACPPADCVSWAADLSGALAGLDTLSIQDCQLHGYPEV